MKSYQVILLCVLLLVSDCSFVNTTDFWKNKLNVTGMHY